MKTMQIAKPTIELILNPDFYKPIHATDLTVKSIGQIVFFIHKYGITSRIITKSSHTHFTHSSLDETSSAESLIQYFDGVMYIDISRNKLFDTATRIILDNQYGNEKSESVMGFFSNRDLIFHTSCLL